MTTATPILQPTVFPLRFTSDAPAMIRLLRVLGMRPAVTAGKDDFGDLIAGAGRVMVHAARGSASGANAGDTDLSLGVPDAEVAAEQLRAGGIEVTVWDESYGKQGVLEGPAEESISLHEEQSDLYGFEGNDTSDADPRLTVVAVIASDSFERDTTWFAQLGFRPDGPAEDGWHVLRGPGRRGAIGLHDPSSLGPRVREGGSPLGPSLQVGLSFETAEDPAQLARRLQDAGFPAEVHTAHGAPRVLVTDPDGQALEVHHRS